MTDRDTLLRLAEEWERNAEAADRASVLLGISERGAVRERTIAESDRAHAKALRAALSSSQGPAPATPQRVLDLVDNLRDTAIRHGNMPLPASARAVEAIRAALLAALAEPPAERAREVDAIRVETFRAAAVVLEVHARNQTPQRRAAMNDAASILRNLAVERPGEPAASHDTKGGARANE